jgi:hypothetical protein
MRCVYIHTNARQMVGAIVSAHSMTRNSKTPDSFEVRIIAAEDHPWLAAREGQKYLRGGEWTAWTMHDLQSFTPLRFMPPESNGYEGRAVVVDPDVFSVGDVAELLDRDMGGKALLAVPFKPGEPKVATSVMALDCAKLTHWRCREQFESMFRGELDYVDWIGLLKEPPGSIGHLAPEWNSFDVLTPQTKMLHNTKRPTQPWKTGLPADFTLRKVRKRTPLQKLRDAVFGEKKQGYARYERHPDPAQEAFFFGLLKECVLAGKVSEERLRAEMAQNHIRHDALEMLDRVAA